MRFAAGASGRASVATRAAGAGNRELLDLTDDKGETRFNYLSTAVATPDR